MSNKQLLKQTGRLYLVEPAELEGFDEWVDYLESILHGPCGTFDIDGKIVLTIIKARVDMVRGMSIEIYPNDHSPPHFHVRKDGVNARYTIEDCSPLDGGDNSIDYRKLLYWHEYAKPMLIEKWNSMRPTICHAGSYKDNLGREGHCPYRKLSITPYLACDLRRSSVTNFKYRVVIDKVE